MVQILQQPARKHAILHITNVVHLNLGHKHTQLMGWQALLNPTEMDHHHSHAQLQSAFECLYQTDAHFCTKKYGHQQANPPLP